MVERVETVVTDGPANQQVEAAAQAKQVAAPVAAPPSPLGVDAKVVEAVADQTQGQPKVAKAESRAESKSEGPPAPAIAPEMAQKLQAYDAIMGNPRLFEALRREYLAMEGATEEVPKQNGAQSQADSPAVHQQLAGLTREIQYMKAAQVVEEFRRGHADFDQHKDAILKTLNQAPGIPLEMAYRLAKADNGQAAPKSVPTSERQTRGDTQSGGFDPEALSREVADRTRFKRTEDAVAHAFKEAMRQAGG